VTWREGASPSDAVGNDRLAEGLDLVRRHGLPSLNNLAPIGSPLAGYPLSRNVLGYWPSPQILNEPKPRAGGLDPATSLRAQ